MRPASRQANSIPSSRAIHRRITIFERDAPGKSRAHFDFYDLAVFDLVQQRHQPSDLGTKRKVRVGDFFAGLFLNVQPDIYENGRSWAFQNWVAIADAWVLDFAVLHAMAQPDLIRPGFSILH